MSTRAVCNWRLLQNVQAPNNHITCLSVSVENAGLSSSYSTLTSMWKKSRRPDSVRPWLSSEKALVRSSLPQPHIVQTKSNNQCLYICDSNCPMFKGFSLCSHVVAEAEVNGDRPVFLKCIQKGCIPNLSAIANQGLPCGSGRKGGVPKHKSVLLQLNLTLVVLSVTYKWYSLPFLLLVLRVIHHQLILSQLFPLQLLMPCLWLLVLVLPLTHA